jgi:hypothetical protein
LGAGSREFGVRLKPRSLFRKIIFLFLLFGSSCSHPLIAQDIKPYTLFGEIGGSGGLGSFNFDRIFYAQKANRFSYRLGISYSPSARYEGRTPTVIIFPTLINYIYGKKDHFLEVGAGQSLAIATNPAVFSRLTLNAGYRFQRNEGGWFFRIAYTPLISFMYDLQWENWAGIGIGYTIRKGKCPCETAK